jgi:hypothetical protein
VLFWSDTAVGVTPAVVPVPPEAAGSGCAKVTTCPELTVTAAVPLVEIPTVSAPKKIPVFASVPLTAGVAAEPSTSDSPLVPERIKLMVYLSMPLHQLAILFWFYHSFDYSFG